MQQTVAQIVLAMEAVHVDVTRSLSSASVSFLLFIFDCEV